MAGHINNIPEDLIGLYGLGRSDFERFSYLFPDPNLWYIYLGSIQWTNISAKDSLKYLGSSFQEYLNEKSKVFDLVLPKEKQDPRVEFVTGTLNNIINKYSVSMDGLKIAGSLYGSFYFGDPTFEPDIDFDFLVVDGNDNSNKLLESVLGDLDKGLDNDLVPGAPHSDIINLEDHTIKLKNFSSGAYNELVGDDTFISYTSLILLSKKMYFPFCNSQEVEQKVRRLTDMIDQISKENPVFRALLISNFIGIKSDRMRCDRPAYRGVTE